MNEEQVAKCDFCVVIPAYQEETHIGNVVREVRKYCSRVLVVDDGSKDATAQVARDAGATVISLPENQGKGAALNVGYQAARDQKAEFLIAMDADGQHDPEEIPKFIEAYRRTGIPVLIGNRMADVHGMPLVRKLTNRFMSWMLSRSMGQYVPDTQCGYRLFRCDVIPFVSSKSQRFAAESEVLLRVAERGIRIDAVRIKTIYDSNHSKINPLLDSVRFFRMLYLFRKQHREREKLRDKQL
ncbi:MAG: glycosyltransferase family 2 protein [Kiritimatiellae bacterium]|nr:glycosyltransferase family 2 protein [Kiritimatiellia bacterium]